MIKIKLNKKILAILLSTGIVFSLSACSNEKEAASINEVTVTEKDIEEDVTSDTSNISLEEFDYFSSDLAEVEGMIEENKFDEVKKYG